jgi:hypothetical protein
MNVIHQMSFQSHAVQWSGRGSWTTGESAFGFGFGLGVSVGRAENNENPPPPGSAEPV